MADKHSTRNRQHIIETESRRKVMAHFPADRFLERDQTERDYGIDMNIECFDDGEPTGAYLYLQIKGTDDPPPLPCAKTIPFDFKVKDLLRAERFITPIILIWCPVKAEPTRFWFLWLQSYIRVVLNYENSSWRDKKWVRLHIPVANVVPDESDLTLKRLRFIAGHPARLEQFGQLTRITQAAPFVWDNPETLILLLEEALGFGAIFSDDTWEWGKRMRMTVERGLEACRIALRGIDPTDEELRQIGWLTLDDPNLDYEAIKASGVIRLDYGGLDKDIAHLAHPPLGRELMWEQRWELLAMAAQSGARYLLNMVAMYFDDRLRNTAWKTLGDHDF